MKPWLRLTLTLVGLALVCLLLNLTQAVALNHPLQTVGSGPRLDRGGKAASDAPSSSLVRSMEFDPARVAPLVLDRALRACNLTPPGQTPHGRPEVLEQPLASFRGFQCGDGRPVRRSD